MVSISDQNPEIRRQPDGQQPPVTTTTPAGDNAGIFRVGLTRTEASKNKNLNSLFNKYNTTVDDVIDSDEFAAYLLNQDPTRQGVITAGRKMTGTGTLVGGALKNVSKNIKSKVTDGQQGTFEDISEVVPDLREVAQRVGRACSGLKSSASGDMQEKIQASSNTSQDLDNVAQDINQRIDRDLDESDANSLVNRLSERYKKKDFNDAEREFFEANGYDLENISDEDCNNLAKEVILAKYTSDMLEPILNAIENNDADLFAKSAQVLMKTNCNTADLSNIIISMAHRAGKSFSEDQIRSMVNTYAQTYQHEEGTDEELENIATTDVMTYADEEYIRILYQNNAQMIDRYNEIAQNVANNTTDETRKSMLNNIVQNSAEIIKNAPNNSNKSNTNNPNEQAIRNSVTPNAPPVSNPIQNSAQVNYINDLKQQAFEFQNQYATTSDTNQIPEHLNHAFSTVREYRSFTGSGMTLFEYQETKSTLKNNFTNAINEIVKDYTTMPDVFKTKVLTLFDSLDDNLLGELFINGNQDIHQFMYKYNYMNDTKLLAFAERKPAEFSNASPKIKLMLTEIKEEQAQKVAV